MTDESAAGGVTPFLFVFCFVGTAAGGSRAGVLDRLPWRLDDAEEITGLGGTLPGGTGIDFRLRSLLGMV